MKLVTKKTSLALALATLSSATMAADYSYRPATDAKLGGYDQTSGTVDAKGNQLTRETANSDKIVSATAKVAGKKVEDNGVSYQQYGYTETRKGEVATSSTTTNDKVTDANTQSSRDEVISQSTQQSGVVTRAANTRVQLNDKGAEIAGSEKRTKDSSFEFSADDLAKVNDAIKKSFYSKNVSTAYVAADSRATTEESQVKVTDLKSEAKRDANGKEITGQFISTGTVASETNSKDESFKSKANAAGKVQSLDAAGRLTTSETSSTSETVRTDYAHNDKGEVAGYSLSADKKYLDESTVVNTKSASTSKDTTYDQVAALNVNTSSTAKTEQTSTSLLDNFNYVNNSTVENSDKVYKDGLSNLAYERSSKSTTKSTDREFVKNDKDEYVLTNGKPTVAYTTAKDTANETFNSAYQPTQYASGKNQGKDYEILNNGVSTRYTDSAVQKTLNKTSSNETKTYADGFVAHNKTTSNDSADYKRSQQENIEVNRILADQKTEDSKQLGKLTLGSVVTKAGTDASFKAGTVALTIEDSINDQITSNNSIHINKDANGNIILNEGKEVSIDQVRSWKDENGKTRHYVVIGQDLDGNDIRSEVTFTGPTAGTAKAVVVDTAKIEKSTKDFQEKVDHSAATVYDLNAKQSSENATTSKDGKVVYNSDKSSKAETVKLYATGKNALAREATQSESKVAVETYFDRDEEGNLLVDAKGNAVVVGVSTESSSANAALQQYQAGQEKVWTKTSSSKIDNQTTDAKGSVVKFDKADSSLAATQYAEGKNALDRTIATTNNSSSKDAGLKIIASEPYYGVDEGGNSLASKNGVLAIDELGQEVKSIQEPKFATTEAVREQSASKKVDENVYQTGAVAYKKSEQASSSVKDTYKDGTVVAQTNKSTDDVSLYNHGQSDKYRDAVKTNAVTASGKTYELNAKGEAVVKTTYEASSNAKLTEVNYQEGKNALESSSVSESNGTEKIITDAATKQSKGSSKSENLVYQEDQKIATEKKAESNFETAVSNKDKSSYTYAQSAKSHEVVNNTDMGLLASQDVKQTNTSERTEALAKTGTDGKSTNVSITRGTDSVLRTDESTTAKVYGSETNTAADGVKTVVAKTQTSVSDKFNTFESDTINRTETKVAADKTSTAKSETRVDNVQGITLTEEKITTDAAGKATTTVVGSTSIKAGEIKVGDVTINADKGLNAGNKVIGNVANGVVDSDAANMGQVRSFASDLNRRVDDVESTAYRGIAIALAAQQPVPNIQPGQFAVFGGVGHYEGESAGALGVTTVFGDGRTSLSGAIGVAGGSEVGGRIGVSYVFGGK
ncbi:YadA C-terminal domain-containing protein [Acinetobacter sp. Marseille-Q1618]|uniref:YadA-like family protein n=1 Tax=Acinetobacter sp. Marseille-Q1618 TaxID=2697502 RepID=UPI0020C56563|nr:YadA C-terminal domain-containing protein [Acinetobacter sp. Marseille-Q1618]